MNGLTLLSTGSCAGSRVVTNDDFAKVLDTSDEWIYSRTGIHERHFCSEEESCVSLAREASKKALERAGLRPEDIDCCIAATVSGGFLESGKAKRARAGKKDGLALVVGCEQLSRLLDPEDRSTCVLFGDGAGAAILRSSDEALYESFLGARGGDEIVVPGPGDGSRRITMDGKAVFRFAVEALPRTLRALLAESGLTLSEVDHVVCHQANSRIIDHCIRSMKADPEKFYKNMDHFGNTSAASIPMALDEMAEKGLLRENQTLLLDGFGAGLTWGGVLFRTDASFHRPAEQERVNKNENAE